MKRHRKVPQKASGRFIVIEGGDGTGKSTLLNKIEHALKARAIQCVRTREPGGTPLAEEIRELILAHQRPGYEIDAKTELLLYEAARAHHVRNVIRPHLAAGTTVLCDRFTYSSIAYQGAARGLGEKTVAILNSIATEGLEPDLVIVLDLATKQAKARRSLRGAANRLDIEPDSFHEKVRRAFLKLAKANPRRCVVLDASLDPDTVFARLLALKPWKRLF
ncbi:MAG TPA: dTMP kinase [Oligoflexia bacterium]|nr:dTMP kinase [Oligoflexia bacterium]